MSQISEAIAARQTQIAQLQREIETLQRAASIVGGGETAPAKVTSQREAPAKPKGKPQPNAMPKAQRKRRGWSASEKAAIGKRMKKYWAKRRKAKR